MFGAVVARMLNEELTECQKKVLADHAMQEMQRRCDEALMEAMYADSPTASGLKRAHDRSNVVSTQSGTQSGKPRLPRDRE